MLTIYKIILFYFIFPPHSKAKTSQQHDWSDAKLILDKHNYVHITQHQNWYVRYTIGSVGVVTLEK